MPAAELEKLTQLLARLPGLGPRSARRVVLHMLKRRDAVMRPLAASLVAAADSVRECGVCGNLDSADPCAICRDPERDATTICVVEEVDDLWALERAGVFRGRYHVLGGTLSALDGVGPDALRINALLGRVGDGGVGEIVLATGATVDGQTTAQYVAERLRATGVPVSRLAQGVPLGGQLEYLDEGTLGAALDARRPMT
jgi:recombination protein RecR